MKRESPYELICNSEKTTLTCPGGVVLGYGPGPGLRHSIFWNRIGSLFSCYRPALAVLDVFKANEPHAPVPLKTSKTRWEPNLCTAQYTVPDLKLDERRTALKAGISLKLKLSSTAKQPREWVLFFHGAVEQWPFFDYKRDLSTPSISCETEPAHGRITLTQPHPHDGLPREVNSIQRLDASEPFAACGFLQNVSELNTLWQEHGCLASLRLRLGQVGGRYSHIGRAGVPPATDDGRRKAAPTANVITFIHQHPVYYFAQRVTLEPGESRELSLHVMWQTNDEGGQLPDAFTGTTRDEWEHYLSEEVPQLECDDEALTRYWYYVWYVLRANRTAGGKHIKHAFTAPSKYMYWGPWIWDGYFHVLGEMWLKDPEVARDSIRAVLDMQFPNGYLPVCSGSNYRMCFHDSVPGYEHPGGGGYASYVERELRGYKEGEHPFEAELEYQMGHEWLRMLHTEKTQTPLISVAAALYCGLTADDEFAGEVCERLFDFEHWLWRRRTDELGRFNLWHGDESGWDNATRHYPVPAKPFDVQVHALLHRQALAALAERCDQLGRHTAAPTMRKLEQLAERIKLTSKSLSTYWDAHDHWYYDLGSSVGGDSEVVLRKQIAPSGLFALLAVQEPHVVEVCLDALQHARVFNTPYPIPSLATCDPDYDPHGWGWNGPVWLQVNYFTMIGLLKAGQYAAAFQLWEQTRKLIIRDGKPHSYELYDPELGTGMGCPDYSWQAMISHLIIRYFAGVGDQSLHPALPPELNYLRLSNLPGLVSAIELKRTDTRVEIKAELETPAHLRINTCGLGTVAKVTANGIQMRALAEENWAVPEGTRECKEWEIIVT